MKILFYDLETTGLDWKTNSIIQFAGILAEMDEMTHEVSVIDTIEYKMKPRNGSQVNLNALEINGFSLNEVKAFDSDQTAFNSFQAFLDKHVDRYNKLDKITLAGYNCIHFDGDFLRKWFIDNGSKFFGAYFWSNQIDVMAEVTSYLISYRPMLKNFKLGNIADILGVLEEVKNEDSTIDLHNALFDVKLTLAIWKKLLVSDKILAFSAEEAERIFDVEKKIIKQLKNAKEPEGKTIIFEG